MLFYPLSAALVLFSNILLNPGNRSASCDLKQLGDCFEYLQTTITGNFDLSDSTLVHLKHVLSAADGLYRMAQRAVEQCEKSGNNLD